jgi:hypothetical protein
MALQNRLCRYFAAQQSCRDCSVRSSDVPRHSAVIAAVFSHIATVTLDWQCLPGRLSFHSPVGVLPESRI